MDIKNTGLWSKAFGQKPDDPDNDAREKLRSAYADFWEKAVILSGEIQKTLPALTLHDARHFEALWRCADLIVGKSIELNPLEVFVFGGAVLIHDAANSVAAFDGGLNEIKGTPEWSDAEATFDSAQYDRAIDDLEKQQIILLETLRNLHAIKAESICRLAVKVDGATFHLLQDDKLREHLGDLIGQVAASHHWDIEELPRRLQSRFGAPSGFPGNWTVRPVLVAGLIRCADAIQLDQSRAPDFLFGLLRVSGVSESHWRAQNRIATPIVDPDEPSSLLFTSTKPYDEGASDAWWVAYDAINMADRELSATDALLKDLGLPSFAISRISHATSPQRLAEHLRVNGWQPVKANLHVSNVDGMVDMFGGEKLYGNNPHVALRELLQNAADAVRLRRALDNSSSGYRGQITVTVENAEDGDTSTWLHVDDDGIGMTQDVLVGPLLDFGSSYMSSVLVKKERPGLIGKKLRRSGKFGIGFFSVFMLGDQVQVTSKPFDDGLASAKTLVFSHGYKRRPILKPTAPANFGATNSTRVSVKIDLGKLADLLTFDKWRSPPGKVSLGDLVSALAPMLDVDIYVDIEGVRELVHVQDWANQESRCWLNSIVPSSFIAQFSNAEESLALAASNIELIDPENPALGRACISIGPNIGSRTVGGLIAHNSLMNTHEDFLGAIEYYPDGPMRMGLTAVAGDKLASWATRQAQALSTQNLSDLQKSHAAIRVTRFGGDAESIAMMKLNRKPSTLNEIYSHLLEGHTLFAPIKINREDTPPLITVIRERHSGFLDNYGPDELELLVDALEPMGESSDRDEYYAVPTEGSEVNLGFINMLIKLAARNGKVLDREFIDEVVFAKYVGEGSAREGLLPGKLIKTSGLKISVREQGVKPDVSA